MPRRPHLVSSYSLLDPDGVLSWGPGDSLARCHLGEFRDIFLMALPWAIALGKESPEHRADGGLNSEKGGFPTRML